ncbi:MAG TPA: prolyl oligopeptidase family serine peptidase [Nocardioidaceae bacterium]|nr:prolyl oligopeptidase family serine peptidase [Nocardioidaceae bacterium]
MDERAPSDFTGLCDLATFTALPRITGLTLSLDGSRLVATVQEPDPKRSKYVSALWEIPLDPHGEPMRLTRSEKGETAPAFLPGGSLLFTSSRPVPDGDDDETTGARLWMLPTSGEPRVVAERPGGLVGPVVAAEAGTILLTGSRLTGSTDGDDAERRKARNVRKVSAIWHTGMPIRYWDHELGEESPRLLSHDVAAKPAQADESGEPSGPHDLVPDATVELTEAAYSISADGGTVATSWRARRGHGRAPSCVELVDVATGTRERLASEDGWEFDGPQVSPGGDRVAMSREREGTFETPVAMGLDIVPAGVSTGSTGGGGSTGGAGSTGGTVQVQLGDVFPTEWAWSRDGGTLFVAGDLAGRGAVVAVDPRTGEVRTRLASDASYSQLCPSPDGTALFALRSAIDSAPAPVRLDVTAANQQPTALPTPAPTPALPGELVEVTTSTADGQTVHSWLCLPAGKGPAPLMLWVHGGPFGSWNSWSWRWNPWVAVARGWAVLLPDPALSTGYGPEWMRRAWPYVAEEVWSDLQTALDDVLARPEVDEQHVACLGASFGGYMTNWIAGHTDRFGAIVTHSGSWALDQQHATTDAAAYKTGIFGTLAEHPEWYAANSPHNAVDDIVTPMLVIHGNRDYRVPLYETLRLWWDLVSRHEDPEAMPHRFLQLTSENHWVLSPSNAEIWYDAVLGFCAQHVLGEDWTPSPLL